uniref:BHLH domain-containing protein n=1 Tax=Mycena chlorophos TaxID=658473 RepID=A0ABQ0L7F2_MYCCL|nr:predicted protein [Mycena chlorophos]
MNSDRETRIAHEFVARFDPNGAFISLVAIPSNKTPQVGSCSRLKDTTSLDLRRLHSKAPPTTRAGYSSARRAAAVFLAGHSFHGRWLSADPTACILKLPCAVKNLFRWVATCSTWTKTQDHASCAFMGTLPLLRHRLGGAQAACQDPSFVLDAICVLPGLPTRHRRIAWPGDMFLDLRRSYEPTTTIFLRHTHPRLFTMPASRTLPEASHMMLPLLSLPPYHIDVEDYPGQFRRRGSEDSIGSEDSERQRLETAARRASHNAVERQRRDKLNARILELATLLPNLAGVRRPSRIAITKSSIAYIHNSRKQRILASQQLQAVHAEAEALRGEVNQWRLRAGLPVVAEPPRGEAFMMVLSGAEPEIELADSSEEEDNGMPFAHSMLGVPYPHGAGLDYPGSGYAYGESPVSSSASLSPGGFPSSPYYPSPPSSASFDHTAASQKAYTEGAYAEPRIACPTPSTAAHPFESQHYMVQTDDEWAAMYGEAPRARAPQSGSW